MPPKKTEHLPPAGETTAPVGGYETFDGDEALRYIQAGGKLVSVVKRYPNSLFKPGKRYLFLESKAALDRLLQRSEEGA